MKLKLKNQDRRVWDGNRDSGAAPWMSDSCIVAMEAEAEKEAPSPSVRLDKRRRKSFVNAMAGSGSGDGWAG
jgi:hypothetical protein